MRSSSSPQATAVSHALASDLCSNFGTIISAMFSNSVRKQTALREKAGTQNEINSKLKFSHFDKSSAKHVKQVVRGDYLNLWMTLQPLVPRRWCQVLHLRVDEYCDANFISGKAEAQQSGKGKSRSYSRCKNENKNVGNAQNSAS
ncbi:uncharacterized protein LOC116269528 isoform X1 [Papio anubis]|uniref:uncharacterized protein LOC116269528 isoform X1 n=1 Tax=Papio anubis TaxID=9555 RepID=UPI0012AE1F79|nr:uncharacterized protein LOC116269528 isoform X1 [Papio anubis]